MTATKICRIYQRVSTSGQDLTRQQQLVADAEAAGFYVAGVYSEKISGTVASRPELNRLIADLKHCDVVIAESLDRISRLPVAEGEALIERITETGPKISVPDLIDLSDIIASSTDPLVQIVLEANQKMRLKIALHIARKDYEQRATKQASGIEVAKIVELRGLGYTIAKVASTLKVSESQVKLILKKAAASHGIKSAANREA